MKIKALKNYKWSIRFQTVSFEVGKEYEVLENDAIDMINNKYAERVATAIEKEQKRPIFDKLANLKSKEKVDENKAIEIIEENKSFDTESGKKEMKPKMKKDKKNFFKK